MGNLIKPSLQGGVSRRSILQGTAAIGATAFASQFGISPAAAQPKKGGTLRIGMAHGNTNDNYDPGTWDNAYVQVFGTARNGYLVEITADGSLTGEVAESWEASPDAKTWTFKIRKGIAYHDGGTVTPEDVVASINYHRGEDSTSAAKPFVDPIEDISVDGDNVVFTLEAGNADFPFVVSDYHLPILPSKDGKIEPSNGIGCGPYKVTNYTPGYIAELTRNPDYWKTDRAHFDGVVLMAIVDPAARQAALMTGNVDVIDGVDLKTVALFQRAPNVSILSTTGTQHYTFAMDTRAAPFSDNNVRMALKHAINRQELVDKILFGYGSVGNDHPISPSNRFYAGDLEQTTYDPDKAKYYLKQAGLDSVKVQLSAADAAFGGAVDAAVLFSSSAEKCGIDIQPVREPNDGYWSDVWMKKPFSAVYWGGRPTEDWMFTVAYASGAPWNDTFWENERFNNLLVTARSELDEGRRADMYREMQNLVRTDGGVIIPMFASYVMAHTDKVQHPEKVAANWTLDGFRAVERWWFA
ncbi:ABC transporter substrate-binding protein [Roseibium sediminicola]|uniref:ABC transporter substrate-binding protein n=1 Tax=Roseibium sediminicola TaxID=2933272 RepID=A0ABT0GT64_9HYPH|nr:ABC transporter substrate-binding protein [Roseibium sp. CAU 1639]MCK7612634.1 ABC transporter substrate-binding protein [Roseibium sp. CAU 1639]